MRSYLISGDNCDASRRIILDAWDDFNSRRCLMHEAQALHFEHEQWWMTCYCGAAWAVEDCAPCSQSNFHPVCFEQVSEGDESEDIV